MLVEMLERGERVDMINFADVGEMAEFPQMYEYIDRVERFIGMPINRLKSDKHTARSAFYGVLQSGKFQGEIRGFPTTIFRGCRFRSWLKTDVLEAAAGKDNIIHIGFACDERSRIGQDEYTSKPAHYRFPLMEYGYSEYYCLNYLKRIDLYNPLYDYFPRLGCFWCPRQGLNSLRNLYRHFPNEWRQLRQMEADWGKPFKHKYPAWELEQRFEKELQQSA